MLLNTIYRIKVYMRSIHRWIRIRFNILHRMPLYMKENDVASYHSCLH